MDVNGDSVIELVEASAYWVEHATVGQWLSDLAERFVGNDAQMALPDGQMVPKWFSEMDIDGDGKISPKEFDESLDEDEFVY